MVLSIMNGYMTWWEIVRSTLLGIVKDKDEDEKMDVSPLEGYFNEEP